MNFIFKNANVYQDDTFKKASIIVYKNIIKDIIFGKIDTNTYKNFSIIDCSNLTILPAFYDVHVHTRINMKNEGIETLKTVTNASKIGGFINLIAMANTNPIISSKADVLKCKKIYKKSNINIYQACLATNNINQEKVNNIEKIKTATRFFSNDGDPIRQPNIMKNLLISIQRNDCYLFVHEETPIKKIPNNLGYYCSKKTIHDQNLDEKYEYDIVKRDLLLNKKINANLHFQHITYYKSIKLINKYKNNNSKITCEVTPHHLIVNNKEINFENGFLKMNPPLVPIKWQYKLIKYLNKGYIDVIATDHAPHKTIDKTIPYVNAKNGVIGLETCFPSLYTHLVRKGFTTISTIVKLLSINPAKIFFNIDSSIKKNNPASFCIYDLNKEFIADKNFFASKNTNSIFLNRKLYGKIRYLVKEGKIIYLNEI